MTVGLKATLKTLAETKNEAALDVLMAGLLSTDKRVGEGALRTMLARRSLTGYRELLRRWSSLPQAWKELVAEQPSRIAPAVREALLQQSPGLLASGCDALLRIREYDLIPVLLTAAEDPNHGQADLICRTLLALVELLYDEIAQPRDGNRRRDPQILRMRALSALENSLSRYERHRRHEILEAFLILVHRENALLSRILRNPQEPAYLPAIQLLTYSTRPGVMRLLLNFVDDPHAPHAVLNVIAHRRDSVFLRHLLNKTGSQSMDALRNSWKRIQSISWVRADLSVIYTMNDQEQAAAVQLVMASGMKRLDVFQLLKFVLRNGNAGGRRAAAVALEEFKGSEANELALQCLQDGDAQVQAALIAQLRTRGIPGATTRIIELLDSPHPIVREAAQQCLGEFSFERFLSTFEIMEKEARQRTGALVRKADPQALDALAKEFESSTRSRKLRALEMAPYLNAVEELEEQIIPLLSDDDQFVRAAAARTLGCSTTARAQQSLHQALLDPSIAVQDAAEQSLLNHFNEIAEH